MRIRTEGCHPSQLLVSATKLRGVLEWFDRESLAREPVSVCRPARLPLSGPIDAEYVLIDGHTRAFVARCEGLAELPVSVVDPEVPAVYARCVEWCREAGVTEPSDLAGRIASHDRYLEEWVERCRDLEGY